MSQDRFTVLYARASTRKHKRWEGDGHLDVFGNGEMQLSEQGTGRELARSSVTAKKRADLEEGFLLMMGGFEVEIQERVDVPTEPETRRAIQPPTPSLISLLLPPPVSHGAESERQRPAFSYHRSKESLAPPQLQPVKRPREAISGEENIHPVETKRIQPDLPSGVRRPFCSPLIDERSTTGAGSVFIINQEEVDSGVEEAVTVAPFIARHLRPHQEEGINFLYKRIKCRSGGAVLADEMGLGKSIQTIAVAWALLRRKASQPDTTVRKCLLVVPSSLVNNWRSEFAKWFRSTTSPAMVLKKASDISCYLSAYKISPFLIISYDMALRCSRLLNEVHFDLLVCDEGHRLKNLQGKLRQALNSLGAPRRLLLTGTPIQNDVDELFSLLDFVVPGHFGTVSEFRGRCRAGQDGIIEEVTSEELQRQIAMCMLRRTSEVNNKHLPQKHEYVLFCSPSPLQKRVLSAIADHVTGDPLVLIDQMRKATNHPAILFKHLKAGVDDQEKRRVSYASTLFSYPPDYGARPPSISESGKLSVLLELLKAFRASGECSVIVSNYTKTLDTISSLCASLNFEVFRLDGQTPVNTRQSLVDRFNLERNAANVFLLSSKAGGVGLNLIGASRLVLFDLDWNPASDLQAMARIWRDGQRQACHIFRLATTGTIDEKILQRQIKKTGLSAVIDIDALASGNEKLSFRDEDLADIFTVRTATPSDTHDMLECACGGDGLLPLEREHEEEEQRMRDEGDLLDEEDYLDGMTVIADQNEAEEKTGEEEAEEGEKRQPLEGEEGKENDIDGELPAGPASMAELFRWRHYSPTQPDAWNCFKATAGLAVSSLAEVSFAFHYSASF